MAALELLVERSPTPVGEMLILTDAQGLLRALDWKDYEPRMHELLRLHYGKHGYVTRELDRPTDTRRRVDAYIEGDLHAIDTIAVATGGTPFQRQVWDELRRIPLGTTISYGEMARRIGRPRAMRAVGLANGANPVSIVIPCHRVIGANASLTGYGGGLHRKVWLLEHEGVTLAGRAREASQARLL